MNSFLDTLKQLGSTRLSIIGGILLLMLAFFIFLSMRVSTPEYSLLYDDLSQSDSTEIAAKLEEASIDYKVKNDGTQVNVSEKDVGRARMILADAGLPNGGSMGYELFDNQSGFGTTNDIVNLNKLRALEGELSRTISALDPVKSARVHLVLPKRELFSRENRQASASVALGIKSAHSLSKEQVLSIQFLVASAVPNLEAKNVSIIDQTGALLARGGEEDQSLATQKADEMRLKYEQRMTRAIEDMISRIVGYGKVRAQVTAELDFDRVSLNEERYDPESQVARSSQTIEESTLERDANEQNVSVENNLPAIGNDFFADSAPSLDQKRLEETTNFEISKTTKSTIREAGELKRLSVAVLIDGQYITDENGNSVYQERSEDQLDKIAALVRSAMGYDAGRGDTLEVVNLQFADIETGADLADNTLFGFDKNRLLQTAEIFAIALAVILILLLVIQPMLTKALAVNDNNAEQDQDSEIETALLSGGDITAALAGPDASQMDPALLENMEDDEMIMNENVQGQIKASSIRKVEDIIENNPDEALSVIRSWMTEN